MRKNGGRFGDKGRENQCWYDVEGNVREAKRIKHVWLKRRETVESWGGGGG